MNAGYIQLRAALDGSFEREVALGRQRVVVSIGAAMRELADELLGKLRYDFESSGLKRAGRLSKAAWRRSEIYGQNRSLEPAALIFSKLPVIVQAFENGQTIRARGGKGLLIPNPDAWPAGRMVLGKGSRVSMATMWSVATQRFGELKVIKRPGRTTLVVAEVRESAARPGSYKRASASAQKRAAAGNYRGLVTVVVFVIVREAKQPRMLHGDTIRARTRRDAARRLDTLFQMYFARTVAGPLQLASKGNAP